MPYITASIIMELLAATFQHLVVNEKERWDAKIYANHQIYNYCYYIDLESIGESIGLNSLTGQNGQKWQFLIDMNTFIAVSAISILQKGTIF